MYLQDGFATVFRILGYENIMLRERELQPFEMDGGTPIDTTTMLNQRWRTKVPQHLIDLGEITVQCNYDPYVYNQIITAILNVPLTYIITFPDKATATARFAMTKFTPASLRIGEFPLAEVKLTPLNRNGSGAEIDPTFVAGQARGTLQWPPSPRPVDV